MASFGNPRKAVLCSFLAVLVSGVATLYLYERLIAEQRPDGVFSGLEVGEFGYLILSEGKCVGWLGYELDYEDGSYSFLSDGEINYSLMGKEDSILIRSGMAFNSLNQLSGFYARIITDENRVREDELVIRGEKINPIFVSMRGKFRGVPVAFQRKIPGPLELIVLNDGKISLRSSMLPDADKRIGAMFQQTALTKALPLELATFDDVDEEKLKSGCDTHGRGNLSLDEASSLTMKLLQQVQIL